MDIGKDLQEAYEQGRRDALNEIMEYTYGMLTAEKFGLQHKIKSMIDTAFFDEAVRRLKEFEDKHLAETEQTEYDKYREKIRAHDPHKDWFEDEQTDCPWK